jgi:hypothetical protein
VAAVDHQLGQQPSAAGALPWPAAGSRSVDQEPSGKAKWPKGGGS